MQAEILNKKGVEEIERIVEANYGVKIDLQKFLVLKTGVDEKVWIASRDLEKIDLKNLRVNSVGLYFGKVKRNKKIKLSIEGCQIVKAKKNFVNVNKAQAESFMSGKDIELTDVSGCEQGNFIFVKHGNNWLGVGKLSNTRLENLNPKSRCAEVA